MRRCLCRSVAVLLCMMILSTGSLLAKSEGPVLPIQPQQDNSIYRLNRYDVLNIVILGMPNILGFSDILIGPDGFVNLPYAGSIKLSGLTVHEATDLLTQRLGEYIKIPGMTLMVKSYGPRKVYVVGEVNSPGIYDLAWDRLNIISALSSAGGIARKGRTKEIRVVRLIDGEAVSLNVNYKNLTRKGDLSQNIPLQDGDLIYVPKSGKIDFNTDIMPFVNVYLLYKAATN